MMMSGRARAQSVTASGNSKAQLIAAYNELGKELGDRRMRVVGNYTIGRAIGEGSYGKVRLGTHRLSGTKVALKQIPKDCSAQLTREIHHHRQLHHPHIVQLYEVIATETSIWLVTELCNGGELFDYLVEKGRFDEHETRILFGQLCLAIAYCHEQGVVHRDIKLENVLLDEHCQVKLSDFGFTREFERGSLLETFCGTTGYASPEMLQGQKYLGPEVDVWSLGIILYSLLVGTLPFDDDDEDETKKKVLAGDFDMPEWISSEAADLLRGILELDPTKRFTIQQIVASPWFNMRIYPASPPPTEAILPLVSMDGEPKPALPASTSSGGAVATSALPDQRPSTPPNQTATQSTDMDPNPQPRLSGGPEASPSRIPFERKNSTHSIAPPLPTRTPIRTKRRSMSSTVSPPATPKVRPLSAALTATETFDFFGTMKKQTAVVFSTPQERLMLSSLAALGFDTGQMVHSVLSNACDSSGALWWILRKKLGSNYMLPEEQTGQVVLDPSESGLQMIAESDGRISELEETGQGVPVNGIHPMVLLEEVDAKKKKKRHQVDSVQESLPSKSSIPTKEKERPSTQAPPPDFAIVPATPITTEELSKVDSLPTSPSALSPIRSFPSQTTGSDNYNSSPPGSKINSKKERSSSISMLQRATTVLGGAAGLGRKKSEENGLRDSGSSRDKDRSSEEPRSSNGSGRLTKSPPPGKISKEAKDRERDNSSEVPSSQKSSGSPSTPATFPGHIKSSSTVAKSNIQQPSMRRSATEGSSLTSPSLSRELAKPRNRSSILNTFRTWLGNDSKRERKGGFTFGTPSNSLGGGFHSSPPSAYSKNYFNRDYYVPSGYPERAQTPRKRSSAGKGSVSRRGGRGHKDKRPSISSRRSSSVNSRRSSVGSMASLAKQKDVLGSVDEYTVYNGASLSRKMSSNSRRSVGAKTPIDEDPFGPSRPGSARSNSMNTSLAKRGKRHSKSSSTSSGGGNNRPPSRSGTTSPTGNRAHRRVGSGGSQTRVVKQHVKPSSSIAKSLAAGAAEQTTISAGTRRMRSGSQSSAHSEELSAVEDDAEFGGRHTTSPLGRPMRTVMVAQKKSAYGTPSGSLGLSAGRSSWKKSWGPEPPGWAHRAAHPGVVVEILDSRNSKSGVRDVFAGGGKSGVAPGATPPGDDEDDWSDIDEDVLYAGGLGQLGSGHNSPPNPHDSVMSPDSPMMVFTNSRAGRRTKRTPGGTMASGQYSKAGGSPTPLSTTAPASPPNQTSAPSINESMNLDRNTSRRQLPGNRTFRGPAIVEEEEEEEE